MQRSRLVRSTVTIVVALLVLPLVVHIGAALLPDAGSYIVLSGSMEPTITSGSLVYVVQTGDYQPGDVITYTHDSVTVTHRIVEEKNGGYVTKGDANDQRDADLVERNKVHGKALLWVPYYGSFLQSALAYRFLLLAGAGGLMILLGARLLLREPPADPG